MQTQKSTRQKIDIKQTPYTENPGIFGTTQQNLVVQEQYALNYRRKYGLADNEQPQSIYNESFTAADILRVKMRFTVLVVRFL